MTETLANHSHAQDEFDRVLPPDLAGSSGIPVPFMQHRIVDPETYVDVPEGTPGMLLVRGYALMAGMNKKERHEVFDEDGWYPTGDRCLFRGGYLFFVDRYNEMIKTSGANVSPPEVEQVLLAMDGVNDAVVLGVPDPARGQIVAASLTSESGAQIDVVQVLRELRTQLSSFKVPKKILVFDDEDFPRLPNGKPDKRALSQVLREAPEVGIPHSAALDETRT
jgi:acyl-CoA synthetase (AMP-forming)/AMP-acid ligase II